MNQEQYLAERIEDQIHWYNRKSRANKRAYRTLRVVSVIVALAIPIMSSFLDNGNVPYLKVAIAVSGALVALIEGLLTLYKFRDNWTSYRNAAEMLIQHKYLFITRSAPYNVARPFVLFVQNAENIMAGERIAWVKLNTAEEEKLILEKEDEPKTALEATGQSGEEPLGPPPAAGQLEEAPTNTGDTSADSSMGNEEGLTEDAEVAAVNSQR